MDELPQFEDTDAIKALLEKAYQITFDGVSLVSRLSKSGFPQRCYDSKQVRQLMKLANYNRICDSMAKRARALHDQFSSLELQVLEPYRASSWQGLKRFVHAEIQMVAYYEIAQVGPSPRVIGASKEVCFLCDSFIRAHGKYYLSRAHRQLYDK